VQVLNLAQTIVPGLVTPMVYRSQSWLNNNTNGTNYTFTGSYVTGAHSIKVGYQGYWWADDRNLNVNNPSLRYTYLGATALSLTEYANHYNVNARAAQATVFAQDQWTHDRLTLQGGLRWDRP